MFGFVPINSTSTSTQPGELMNVTRLLLFLLVLLSFNIRALDCPQWSSNEAKAHIAALGDEIRHHDILYYERHAPVISDAEYDALERQLARLQKCFPDIPVQRYQPETQTVLLSTLHLWGA